MAWTKAGESPHVLLFKGKKLRVHGSSPLRIIISLLKVGGSGNSRNNIGKKAMRMGKMSIRNIMREKIASA